MKCKYIMRSGLWMGCLLLPLLSHAVEIEMVSIPAGDFTMGSSGGYNDEKPNHVVHVPGFKMSKYEVTQAQYKAVLGNNPSEFKGDDNRPVETVSWYAAQEFIEQLFRQTGKRYRLPSEAEWEYAARAGSGSQWSWGDNPDVAYKYAWFVGNSDKKTHPVGRKLPNAFGLYDMHGNVWEWVEDCWNDNYSDAPEDGSARESGKCSERTLRGGSSFDYPDLLRSSLRYKNYNDHNYLHLGFRLVQDL